MFFLALLLYAVVGSALAGIFTRFDALGKITAMAGVDDSDQLSFALTFVFFWPLVLIVFFLYCVYRLFSGSVRMK